MITPPSFIETHIGPSGCGHTRTGLSIPSLPLTGGDLVSQAIPTFRVESLVIAPDDPAANLAEFLNSLTEDEETAVLDYLTRDLATVRTRRTLSGADFALTAGAR